MALYVGSTSLLLHGNGADGSTIFVDESGNSVTPYGNARISTAQSKFGGSSMYFDGVGDYLSMPTSDAFNFGQGDFTVETWFYETVPGASSEIVGKHTTEGGYSTSCTFILYSENSVIKFSCYVGLTAYTVSAPGPHPLNSWHHVAAVRNGTSLTLFIDGSAVSVRSIGAICLNFGPTNVSIASIMMGALGNIPHSGGYYFGGYIDDLHIVNGYALYTTNFTPPVSPPVITQGFQIQIQAHDPGITKLAKYDPSQAKPVISEVKDDLQDRWPYGPWKTPAVQFEFKGRGVITGTVAEKALPVNTPLRRLVMLHRLPEGVFVKAVWSDAVTGNYTFNGVRADHKYFVTSFDYTGTYRAVIADNLVPTPL